MKSAADNLSVRVLIKSFVATLIFSGFLAAQYADEQWSNSRGVVVRGEVSLQDGGPTGHNMMVELETAEASGMPLRATVNSAGEFMFPSVKPGEYQLQVMDTYGNAIYSMFTSIRGNDVIEVRIPVPKMERPVSGMVSVAELQRKIDPKAVKEFRRSAEAGRKGGTRASIAHLAKAIEIDPTYVEAYNNLGAKYLEVNEYVQALEQFQKAAALDPDSAVVQTNLSVVLFALQRYGEAERAARNAVRADPLLKKARYVLGMCLKLQNRGPEEALRALEDAAPEFPNARLAAAEILARKGETSQAAAELRRYLSSGQPGNRAAVEGWLAKLEKGSKQSTSSQVPSQNVRR